MSQSRRSALPQGPSAVSNPALEMERYLPSIQTGGENKSKDDLLSRLASATPTDLYKRAYARWRKQLEAAGATTHRFKALGSITVGLASESVLETSLTLHPVYGMPYLPGDALKGLARHYFESGTAKDDGTASEYAKILFGEQDGAAHLRYYDAWYIPGNANDRPLRREVLTVHHPKYYTGDERRAPWDFDDPNPVPYLSAQGEYLVAVSCPTDPTGKWTEYALRLLAAALSDWGIGGKTSSGDGRLTPDPPLAEPGSVPPPVVSEWAERIRKIRPQDVKPQIGSQAAAWADVPDDSPDKRPVAEALLAKIQEISDNRWPDQRVREKPWYIALNTYLEYK